MNYQYTTNIRNLKQKSATVHFKLVCSCGGKENKMYFPSIYILKSQGVIKK